MGYLNAACGGPPSKLGPIATFCYGWLFLSLAGIFLMFVVAIISFLISLI